MLHRSTVIVAGFDIKHQIEHGLILCSTDGDFSRFPGLRWNNPIAQV